MSTRSDVIDVETGFTQVYHQLSDGRHVLEKKSNAIGAIIEANKRDYNNASGRMGDFVMVGRIDAVVLEKWCREDGVNYLAPENKGKLLKKLEERDNRLFKTHPGKFA